MASLGHALDRAYRFEWAGGGRGVASMVWSEVVWSEVTDGLFDLVSWELGSRVAYWMTFGAAPMS